MYDELLKALRCCASPTTSCLECPFKYTEICFDEIKLQAADAIEELSKPIEEYLKIHGYCPTCKRSSGVRNDGTTACPLEKHYVLPLDGYCHLYEPKEET